MKLNNTQDITSTTTLREVRKDVSLFKSTAKEWDEIKWTNSFENVQRLKYRIYIQTQRVLKDPSKENLKKLSLRLERMLFSYDNLVIAVRKVT